MRNLWPVNCLLNIFCLVWGSIENMHRFHLNSYYSLYNSSFNNLNEKKFYNFFIIRLFIYLLEIRSKCELLLLLVPKLYVPLHQFCLLFSQWLMVLQQLPFEAINLIMDWVRSGIEMRRIAALLLIYLSLCFSFSRQFNMNYTIEWETVLTFGLNCLFCSYNIIIYLIIIQIYFIVVNNQLLQER
jgi:hypothetical protein